MKNTRIKIVLFFFLNILGSFIRRLLEQFAESIYPQQKFITFCLFTDTSLVVF